MSNEDEAMNVKGASAGVVQSTGSRFYAALVNHGVPALLAAAIIGAAYAALVAWGVLSLPGEGGEPEQVEEAMTTGK